MLKIGALIASGVDLWTSLSTTHGSAASNFLCLFRVTTRQNHSTFNHELKTTLSTHKSIIPDILDFWLLFKKNY
ncbi:hypothetical protein CMV_022512 [Castanea mollissima]|uniref:Uncharacterized protein n=1 Tax=Castanea mollissima TaxID=60419 RepID=A0A8J4VEA7_9ROSI|nr:hypothetical protein CMV_022512 [Castanea mollissima]